MGDHVPFTMIGVMKVKLVQISAILGGTKLVGDIQNVTASVTYKEIVRGEASIIHTFLLSYAYYHSHDLLKFIYSFSSLSR